MTDGEPLVGGSMRTDADQHPSASPLSDQQATWHERLARAGEQRRAHTLARRTGNSQRRRPMEQQRSVLVAPQRHDAPEHNRCRASFDARERVHAATGIAQPPRVRRQRTRVHDLAQQARSDHERRAIERTLPAAERELEPVAAPEKLQPIEITRASFQRSSPSSSASSRSGSRAISAGATMHSW